MKNEAVYDVVKTLVGPISPVGETNEDNRRMENLKEMTELVARLLDDIGDVARYNKSRPEHSMQQMGKHAHSFMTSNGIKDY